MSSAAGGCNDFYLATLRFQAPESCRKRGYGSRTTYPCKVGA